MRIALLTNAFPPDARGGAGVIADVQACLLRARGHEVRVFLGDLSWTHKHVFARLMRHVQDLQPHASLVRDIVAWKPDRLLTHNLTGCGWGTPAAVRATGVPWVHVLHDVQGFEPSGQVRDIKAYTLWQRAWTYLRTRTMGDPDVLVSPTRWLVDVYTCRGWFTRARVQILPNPAPECEQHDDGSPHVPVRLLYVGRLSSDKGIHIARAIAESMGAECTLTVIGGDGTATLNTRYLGVRTTQDILHAMRTHDVLLVPSCIIENQPTVLLEAMSCGLPIVARAIGGIPETIGNAGMLCVTENTDEWVEAIYAVVRNWNVHAESSRIAWESHDPAHYGDELVACVSNADRSNL